MNLEKRIEILEKRVADLEGRVNNSEQLVVFQEGDNNLETTYVNKRIKSTDGSLESAQLKLKGVFDISGRDSLSDKCTKRLIKEMDDLIQKYTDDQYHVRLVISRTK